MGPGVGRDRLQTARESSLELQLHRMIIRGGAVIRVRHAGEGWVGIAHDLSTQQSASGRSDVIRREHLVLAQEVVDGRVPLHRVGQLQLRIKAIDGEWWRRIKGWQRRLCGRQRINEIWRAYNLRCKWIACEGFTSLPVSEIVKNSEPAANRYISAALLERVNRNPDSWCEIVIGGFVQWLTARSKRDGCAAVHSGDRKREIAVGFRRWWIDVPA